MNRKKTKRLNKDELTEYEIPKALRKKRHAIEDEEQDLKHNKFKNKRKKSFKKKLFILFLLVALTLIIIELFRIHTWKTMAREMLNNAPSSVVDTNGKVIAQIGAEKIKEPIEGNSIPQDLKNAYVSIEDQRFYKHHGVDIKRTASAIASYIIHFGKSSFGGSSITQQLVKNMTGDDATAVSRKVTEWVRATTLEIGMTKDEVLETYLNIIYTGPNVYGVQAGSKYYFDKDVSDLSLEECAFLAGINHSPNSYNPYDGKDKTEKISKRTKTVLYKMQELEFISQEEYDEAIKKVDNGFTFKQGKLEAESNGLYSYHTDALISDLVNTLSNRKNISTKFATNYLNMAGLKIYSTQDSSIQDTMEKEFAKGKYILKSSNDTNTTSQAAMVIIDHSTGNVVGCTGGLGKKTEARGLNRAVQTSRQTGSAIKPVAILGPAIQEKIITPITTYDDSPTSFDIGKDEPYSPTDYDPYQGVITVRRAVESSQNIPFVKMMEQLTPAKSIKYMKKLGITTLTEKDESLPLALGGLEKGMTPLETASSYAAIANDGVYISPAFYTKVENKNAKVVLKAKHKKRRVFSEATCYVLKQLLTQPVTGSNGTATYCSISGMDVAAKTGTTNDNYDRWLCGFTPYYTAATWYGFDMNESINFSGKNPAGLLWAHVMNNVHSNLSSKKFKMPKSGVTSCTICSETNKLANSGCPNRYTEYFLKGTLPDMCTLHTGSTTDVKSNRNTVTTTKGLHDEDVPDVEEPKETTNTNTSTSTNSLINNTTVNTNTQSNNGTNNYRINTNATNTNTSYNTNTSVTNSTNSTAVDNTTSTDVPSTNEP